jgi:hypothetical protein
MRHYETNQNTKLVIRIIPEENWAPVLEIDNYTGFMNFDVVKELVVDGMAFTVEHHIIEFVENKPIFHVFVRQKFKKK